MNYTKFWGVGEALAPPDLGSNKNKVVPSKKPSHKSHKPKFQKKSRSFQSSDNRADKIWSAGKAPSDVGKKTSKASSLKITKTKDPPIALVDPSIGN